MEIHISSTFNFEIIIYFTITIDFCFVENFTCRRGGTGLSTADVRVTAWARDIIKILLDNGDPQDLTLADVDDIGKALKEFRGGVSY